MDSEAWRTYFERNRRREPLTCGPVTDEELSPELRAALVHAIGVFQLGEAAGGSLARRIYGSRDPALDPASRRAIELYVREEGRHAGELFSVLRALGGRRLERQWSNSLFSRCRRALGLRTKLLTMAAAEAVGIAFYGMIRERVPSPSIARVMAVIEREESRHLDFQADWFARALALRGSRERRLRMAALRCEFRLILGAAIATVLVDHRKLFSALGVGAREFARACAVELEQRRFLAPTRGDIGELTSAAQ